MSHITLLDGGMGQELVHRSGDRPTPLWSTQVMVDHPGIVQVYEVGRAGSLCYIVQARCEGNLPNLGHFTYVMRFSNGIHHITLFHTFHVIAVNI